MRLIVIIYHTAIIMYFTTQAVSLSIAMASVPVISDAAFDSSMNSGVATLFICIVLIVTPEVFNCNYI